MGKVFLFLTFLSYYLSLFIRFMISLNVNKKNLIVIVGLDFLHQKINFSFIATVIVVT